MCSTSKFHPCVIPLKDWVKGCNQKSRLGLLRGGPQEKSITMLGSADLLWTPCLVLCKGFRVSNHGSITRRAQRIGHSSWGRYCHLVVEVGAIRHWNVQPVTIQIHHQVTKVSPRRKLSTRTIYFEFAGISSTPVSNLPIMGSILETPKHSNPMMARHLTIM